MAGFLGIRKEEPSKQDLPENFQPMTDQEMSAFGLQCYLEKFNKMLRCGLFSDGLDIPSVATEITFIYESLREVYISPTQQDRVVVPTFKPMDHKELKHVIYYTLAMFKLLVLQEILLPLVI